MKSLSKLIREMSPSQVIALGFVGMILVGAILLSLPAAEAHGKSVGFLNALFTSTSAICVTGLAVVDTGTTFSLFGQMVIILLIQAGGLGFMTVATMLFLLIGKKISLKERMIIRDSLNEEGLSGMVATIKRILLMTFVCELAGAVLLSIRFIPMYGALKGIYFSFFHAVSAFCNAGFDLFGGFRNLTPFANDALVNITVMALIVTGGIGFIVINDVVKKIKDRKKTRLTLHSKIALTMTAALILSGAILFYVLESGNQKTIGSDELNPGGRVLASFFQSVTARTAGYNTISQNDLGAASKLLTIILMFIGASPAGTGGGIKTTTAVVMLLFAISLVRGRKDVNILNKRIETGTIVKAVAITVLSVVLVFSVVFLMLITEKREGIFTFENIMFEVMSAFGTVGLSCGLTPMLSPIGKILIILTMYGGRVGLLTLIMAIANRSNREEAKIRFPEDKVIVG